MNWVRRKFNWLDRIAKDPALRGLPLAVAVRLASRYLNSESKEAWPSVDRLADDLGIGRRSCLRAIDKLVRAGRLNRVASSGGSHHKTNRYSIPKVRRVTRDPQVRKGCPRVANTGDPQDTITLEENPGGTRESPRLRRNSLSDPDSFARKKKKRPNETEFPEGWVLGNAELAVARQIAGWDLPTTEEQFDVFHCKCLDKGWTSANWPAAWRTWCYRGRDYAAKQEQEPTTGMRGAMAGIKDWLDQQDG